jgi:hypothetical protein
MKLTAKLLKKLIKEELDVMKETASSANVKAAVEKGMNSITPEEYQKALEDPKTQEALAKIAAKLGLGGLNEEETDEEYAERKDKARLKAKVSDAITMAAGSSAIFAINALGVGGATLVTTAGVGALAGLLVWYLGGWGDTHDSYKYSELANPETGEREEKTYDPMDDVVKRK